MTTTKEENTDLVQTPSSRLAWILLAIVAAAGVLVYLNSLAGVFMLDDLAGIVENDAIRDFASLRTRRPVTDLTLAINYRIGGLAVGGYHAVNIAIHVLAACTLFGLVRRSLLFARTELGDAVPWLAFAVALLWAVHPLQTQSVTYIIQRSESLMGLFYLLTLYCVARGAGARGSAAPWYAAAVFACALGMGSKAVMVTAPIVALLYDRVFIASSFAEIARRRWALYAGLAATWGVLFYSGVAQSVLFPTADSVPLVGFGYEGITPIAYLRTQPEVILHYLRLVVWPHPLCLDYWWLPATGAGAIVSAIVVLGFLGATVLALWKSPRLGFVAAAFFLVLAPTSSFIPIRDLAFEHRMYLPLAAVLVLLVLGAHRVMRLAGGTALAPAALLALLLVAGGLSWHTIDRNRDYQSLETMWRDVMTKRPLNPRAPNNLGSVLAENGKLNEAIEVFQKALEFPEYRDVTYINMGKVYALAGQNDLAITAYLNALVVNPDRTHARHTVANLLVSRARMDEAIDQLREVLRREPDNAEAHADLGRIMAALRNLPDAVRELERALELNPANAVVRNNLAGVYAMQGQPARALEQVVAALELDPSYEDAVDNMARLIALSPAPETIAARYADRISTDRAVALAYVRRGDDARRAGEADAARAAYARALEIMPDLNVARQRLGSMLGK